MLINKEKSYFMALGQPTVLIVLIIISIIFT